MSALELEVQVSHQHPNFWIGLLLWGIEFLYLRIEQQPTKPIFPLDHFGSFYAI